MKRIQQLIRNIFGLTGIATLILAGTAVAQVDPYAEPEEPGLPPSNMELDLSRTAIVVTDPQIDFLSPDGVTWGLVGNSVTANGTVENIEELFKTAKARNIPVFYFTSLLLSDGQRLEVRGCARKGHACHRHVRSCLSLVDGRVR